MLSFLLLLFCTPTGFWPTTCVEANVGDQIVEDGEDREEFGENDPYMGLMRS